MEPDHIGRVELICRLSGELPERPSLSIELINSSPETIHIFDSPRMPYFLRREDGSLLVLMGVNPPDPEIDYGMIEIPLTRPLLPGESASWQVELAGVHLKDHYQTDREPAGLHGPIPVVVQVGWGSTPIEPADRYQTNIHTLLEWQEVAECAAGEVMFP